MRAGFIHKCDNIVIEGEVHPSALLIVLHEGNSFEGIIERVFDLSQCQPKSNPPKVVKIRAISRKLACKVRTLLRSFSKNIIKFSPL